MQAPISEKYLSFLQYRIAQNKTKDLPQRRAHLGISRKEAEWLANAIGARFVAHDQPLEQPVAFFDERPLVVYINDGWSTTDPRLREAIHLLMERPPRYGGPPLTLEIYKDRESFVSHCPSRHHVDWISALKQETGRN